MTDLSQDPIVPYECERCAEKFFSYKNYKNHMKGNNFYWIYTGLILYLYRIYTGFIQDLYWIYTGFIQYLYRIYTGFIQDLCRICTGFVKD